MIEKYLDETILALRELVKITQKDIANIQKADHSELDANTALKTKFISEFENAKKSLDLELVAMAKENPNTNLSDILTSEVKAKLSELRTTLLELKKINKEYAKSVVLVKDFFDTLSSKIFGSPEKNEYSSKAVKQNASEFYKARV